LNPDKVLIYRLLKSVLREAEIPLYTSVFGYGINIDKEMTKRISDLDDEQAHKLLKAAKEMLSEWHG
jgi:hypothetical protein